MYVALKSPIKVPSASTSLKCIYCVWLINMEVGHIYTYESYDALCTVVELLGDLLRNRPKEADGIESVIVVDNIPQVGPEKQEKLKNMIRKIFGKFGIIQSEYFPLENDITKG